MKFLFTNDPPVIMFGLKPGLEKANHHVNCVPLWRYNYEHQDVLLVKAIEDFKPDYIFTEGDPPNFNRQVVLELAGQYSIPIIYWAIQDPVWYEEISLYCARRADFVFTTTFELLRAYASHGIKAHTLLFGCNPEFHRKVPSRLEYEAEAVFVGNNYEKRGEAAENVIGTLVDAGFNVHVWGNWWEDSTKPFFLPPGYCRGSLPYHLLPAVYGSAKVVLGLHLSWLSLTQTSVRTYEVLGCGAFYLTQYTPAHKNLFCKGVHLEWAGSKEESLEVMEFYLANPRSRERIARAGQEHVYKHHNTTLRAQQLVDVLRKS